MNRNLIENNKNNYNNNDNEEMNLRRGGKDMSRMK